MEHCEKGGGKRNDWRHGMGSMTLSRYFAWRFFIAVTGVFIGVYTLVAFVDYIDAMRKASDVPNTPTTELMLMSAYRVPQTMEQLLPFSVLVGAMVCFFGLSRRMELVVARGAGMSVWQIIAPAILVALVLGVLGTTVYNPVSASLREASKRIEAKVFGQSQTAFEGYDSGYMRQRGSDGDSIVYARQSREQGLKLSTVTVFAFNQTGEFKQRIEAQEAELQPGAWKLKHARLFGLNTPPQDVESYLLPTKLTREQVAESFAAPDTVGFWHLPASIRFVEDSGLAAAGYRLQYQILIARPFLLAAMVVLASSVSLRAFRFGGVPQRILMGVGAGFSLYVLSKVTGDLSKADLLHPVLAAWLPVGAGGLSGLLVLLHEEDG
jgi:lipopolysaccharide export system permease protein